MSRRRDIEQRLRAFGDIHKILGSMRTLAYLEIRKLTRFLSSQRRVVESIERAAADFLAFHPGLLCTAAPATRVFVLIGSERGFCGDFNELLLRDLDARAGRAQQALDLIPVGQKLCAMLEGDPRVLTALGGPSVAEEVDGILPRLVAVLNEHGRGPGAMAVQALHHDAKLETVRAVPILPPFQALAESGAGGRAPVLNLTPEVFLVEIVDQYLFAVLYQLIYSSLMAEQQFRVRHLEGAMKRLEEKVKGLALMRSTLRQEEIIEEIEVILLSADESPGAVSRK